MEILTFLHFDYTRIVYKNLKKFLHTFKNFNNKFFYHRSRIVLYLFFIHLNLSIRIHNQEID